MPRIRALVRMLAAQLDDWCGGRTAVQTFVVPPRHKGVILFTGLAREVQYHIDREYIELCMYVMHTKAQRDECWKSMEKTYNDSGYRATLLNERGRIIEMRLVSSAEIERITGRHVDDLRTEARAAYARLKPKQSWPKPEPRK